MCAETQVVSGAKMVYKGMHSFVESYSSFFDNGKRCETSLRAELTDRGVTDVFVCGLATDVCVGTYSNRFLCVLVGLGVSVSGAPYRVRGNMCITCRYPRT